MMSENNNLITEDKKIPNFINGNFELSKTTEWIQLTNPATQEILGYVPQSTREELERAEKGAYEAYKKWKEVPIQQRQVVDVLVFQVMILMQRCSYFLVFDRCCL
jgi:delta 1-pyrroline-5-carboxylate dehydrogenase